MMEAPYFVSGSLAAMAGEAAAFLLALVFARAGLHKLGDAARFTGVLSDYQLVPAGQVDLLARALPVIEVCVATGLAAGSASASLRASCALVAIALLAIYATAMGVNLLRGRHWIDCGCGGAAEPLSWLMVGRNVLLASLGLVAAAAPAGAVEWEGHTVMAAIALLAFVCVVAMEQALANDRLIRRRRAEARSWIAGVRT